MAGRWDLWVPVEGCTQVSCRHGFGKEGVLVSSVESVPFAVPCRASIDLGALPGLAPNAITGVFLWHLTHRGDSFPERTWALCCPSSLDKGHHHEGTAAGTPIQSAHVASLGLQRAGEATIIILGQPGEEWSKQMAPLRGSGHCPPYLDSLVLPGGPSFSLPPPSPSFVLPAPEHQGHSTWDFSSHL